MKKEIFICFYSRCGCWFKTKKELEAHIAKDHRGEVLTLEY